MRIATVRITRAVKIDVERITRTTPTNETTNFIDSYTVTGHGGKKLNCRCQSHVPNFEKRPMLREAHNARSRINNVLRTFSVTLYRSECCCVERMKLRTRLGATSVLSHTGPAKSHYGRNLCLGHGRLLLKLGDFRLARRDPHLCPSIVTSPWVLGCRGASQRPVPWPPIVKTDK